MRRVLPLLLMAAGLLLLLAGTGYAYFSRSLTAPDAAPLPEQVAGLPLTRKTTGWQAVNEMAHLHGKAFPLSAGAVGVYGEAQQATLWVAGAPLELVAGRMLAAMREKIAAGNSPFTPTGERQDQQRTIYTLDGMGQQHFYFRSGSLLVWLAANPELADEALSQVLEFYP